MKRIFSFTMVVLTFAFFAVPAVSFAAALTSQQSVSLITVVQSSPDIPANAFVPLITAFSNITVTQATSLIAVIQAAPGVPANAFVDLLTSFTVDTVVAQPTTPVATTTESSPVTAPHVPPIGSPYTSSFLGYDLSYNTISYPSGFFHFGVIGVTGGKAFIDNSRIHSEIMWAQTNSISLPTMYMNLNAPYGSTVAANIGGPKTCSPDVSTSTEPTVCEGYNYGYNAAAHSFAYAERNGISPSLWWLDIEEANSWSPDTSVNDATIQGAIDYLNMQGVRVGIYSVPRMWADIAGTGFVPNQTINGAAVSVPNWVPIGIDNQIGALNTCVTGSGFITGSPVWLIQYEADSTAVDQNIAC